ncbi:1,4-alpha-glucan branching enzyme [Anaeromicropila populeti]|uniref:1,4-alpha-glucan branching enzyme GlgB n=1 Tax=Anaeromicropila populeti TaxID=37658 RepID=A0A1I6IQL4_9FIRM|nr:1,4-alpha-glucan branching protein GlgB [Anaeromicropila populeti]SFR69045.1 1,4-alpha-glucan branching enzyme [Anaeromicropila populeti]
MDKLLYDLMNWEKVESIVYADTDHPDECLGAFLLKEGILIQAFFPDAKEVYVVPAGKEKKYKMEMVDENGFFAVLVARKKLFSYSYRVVYQDGVERTVEDPYRFKPTITSQDLLRFAGGIHYSIYEKLGAHPVEINSVKGVAFAVWAPNAVRVSVVGDFNFWDGRRNQMIHLDESGVFWTFVPGLEEGSNYKYEIKIKGDLTILKADPYGFGAELRPNSASVVRNIELYQWQDDEWLKKRKKNVLQNQPVSIYEVHLGSWKKPEDETKEFYNYRQLADMLAEYLIEMHYTHVEILPVMEHPFDASWGYQVTGYYAPTARYGTCEDFMYFIDTMHQNNIGVILDWVPAHFPRDAFGLANFDGTCLYEHLDPRQGAHPHWGTLIFNYGRPQVSNFLIANALFWVEKYHADGIRMDAVASMLYLDYGKEPGQWIPNMYGGKENLEALELLKHLNSIMKKREDGAVLIAEESTAWPMVTENVESGGLGFDFKWNMGWMNDFLNYMRCDPLFRKGRHGELTFSMIYAYSEKFILVFSHDEVVHGKGSMIQKMPGDYWEMFSNLRAAYGYMMTHPGKKLLFMGQEFAQFAEWDEKKELDWKLIEDFEAHQKMQNYVREWNLFYQQRPALYCKDDSADGFEWISCLDCDHSIIAFLRKSNKKEETLLVVCNFTPVVYNEFLVGVPFKGRYKEIFNSDRVEYGGEGNCNPRLKQSKSIAWDGREESIKIVVPPLGISVFTCTPLVKEEEKAKKQKRTRVVKTD